MLGTTSFPVALFVPLASCGVKSILQYLICQEILNYNTYRGKNIKVSIYYSIKLCFLCTEVIHRMQLSYSL